MQHRGTILKLVMKFGGTSLANAARMKSAARIIQRHSQGNKVVVVASAIGETTDQLIEIAELARGGDLRRARKLLSKILVSHLKIAHAVAGRGETRELVAKIEQLNSELQRTVEGIAHLRELTSRSRDYLLSFGERLSTPILAATLSAVGLRTRALTGAEAGIATDDNFGEARPLIEISYHEVQQRLDPLWSRRVIPIVAGFIAATVDGSVTTLGRGGSDYTATLLAAALRADEIWIWTDVDGLMTADPRIVKNAVVLPNISFGEALELSYFGAKMMHPRALQPAEQKKVPVRIKNASKPSKNGTLVSASESHNGNKVVKAVSIIRNVGIVNVGGTGMPGAPGVAARIFQTLGSNNINVMMISQGSSEATISCVVAKKDMEKAVRALQLALLGQGYVDRIVAEKDACIIAVVGSGMKGTPGVAARVFSAVARRMVNVRMVAQGSSEHNISFIVSEKEGPEAIRAIHEEFQLGKPLPRKGQNFS
jgi:aspartate kinase